MEAEDLIARAVKSAREPVVIVSYDKDLLQLVKDTVSHYNPQKKHLVTPANLSGYLQQGFLPTKDASGNEYNRVVIAADYISGDNAIGGGGFGLNYFFTKDVSLLTGPVWFNDSDVNGRWKWTIQLDINVPVFDKLFK